jgi:hypothetical protein
VWSPLSTWWEKACRASHVIELRVDAYRGGVLVASDLPVDPDNASITVDSTSDVRREINLTISDPTMAPTLATSVLTPHGTELRVTRGFRYPDGTKELIPVGRFRIDRPSTPLTGPISITGVDYSRLLAEDGFVTPVQSVPGATVIQEIVRRIQESHTVEAVGSAPIISNLSSDNTSCEIINWEQDSNRWDAIKELALRIGVDVAPNPIGTWVIKKLPEVTDTPVSFSIDIGDNGVLTEGTEEWQRDETFNLWIARGEPGTGSAPVQGIKRDLTSGSPTNWDGPFGHRTKVFSSPLLTTQGQCDIVAQRLLDRSIAAARSVKVSCIPNPALDVGDVVNVVLPGYTPGMADPITPRVTEKHMIRSYTMPLGLGTMELDLTAPRTQ